MYIKEQNLLFIHIPKNGGTAISKSFLKLMGPELQKFGINETDYVPATNNSLKKLSVGERAHLTIQQYLDFKIINKKELSSINSFAVIRDPMDRAISTFLYLQENNLISKEMSLKTFFTKWLPYQINNSNAEFNYFVSPQFSFISINNEIVIKNILSFNNLNNDFLKFVKKMGIGAVLDKENSSQLRTQEFLEEAEIYKNVIIKLYELDYELISLLRGAGNFDN